MTAGQFDSASFVGSISILEKADLLMKLKRHSEARTFLVKSLTSRKDRANAAMMAQIAMTYYKTSSFSSCKQWAEKAVSLANSIDGQEETPFDGFINKAKQCLMWMSIWHKQPIVCWPEKVTLSLKKKSEASINIRVPSVNDIVVVSDNPSVKIKLHSLWKEGEFGFYFDREMIVSVSSATPSKTLVAKITVRDKKDDKKKDIVQIHLN